jgi:hypothetical protein
MEKNTALRWSAGIALAAAAGTVIYQFLKSRRDAEEPPLKLPVPTYPSTVSPSILAANARGPQHFDAKHPYPEMDHAHRAYQNQHHTNVGNGPGERNQIGGRSSGKTARFK